MSYYKNILVNVLDDNMDLIGDPDGMDVMLTMDLMSGMEDFFILSSRAISDTKNEKVSWVKFDQSACPDKELHRHRYRVLKTAHYSVGKQSDGSGTPVFNIRNESPEDKEELEKKLTPDTLLVNFRCFFPEEEDCEDVRIGFNYGDHTPSLKTVEIITSLFENQGYRTVIDDDCRDMINPSMPFDYPAIYIKVKIDTPDFDLFDYIMASEKLRNVMELMYLRLLKNEDSEPVKKSSRIIPIDINPLILTGDPEDEESDRFLNWHLRLTRINEIMYHLSTYDHDGFVAVVGMSTEQFLYFARKYRLRFLPLVRKRWRKKKGVKYKPYFIVFVDKDRDDEMADINKVKSLFGCFHFPLPQERSYFCLPPDYPYLKEKNKKKSYEHKKEI